LVLAEAALDALLKTRASAEQSETGCRFLFGQTFSDELLNQAKSVESQLQKAIEKDSSSPVADQARVVHARVALEAFKEPERALQLLTPVALSEEVLVSLVNQPAITAAIASASSVFKIKPPEGSSLAPPGNFSGTSVNSTSKPPSTLSVDKSGHAAEAPMNYEVSLMIQAFVVKGTCSSPSRMDPLAAGPDGRVAHHTHSPVCWV
jgi:hypothetical protein